jgi:hypothetical protein
MEGCGQKAAQARGRRGGYPNVPLLLQPRNNRGPAATIIFIKSAVPRRRTSFRETRLSIDHNLRAIGDWKSNARIAPTHPDRPFAERASLAANRTTQPERHQWRLSFDCAIAHTENYIPRHAWRSKGIASFLCDRHFLRQFSSRNDAARAMRTAGACRSYARENNAVRNLSQMFRSPAGIEARAKGWAHERLSRHHIAPAQRKSAAHTSSHGPVLLFLLRCG